MRVRVCVCVCVCVKQREKSDSMHAFIQSLLLFVCPVSLRVCVCVCEELPSVWMTDPILNPDASGVRRDCGSQAVSAVSGPGCQMIALLAHLSPAIPSHPSGSTFKHVKAHI